MGSICMIYVKEKDLVVPGEILAEDDYYAGRGTFQENGKVCSNLLGLVSLRNKKISVIPLKSKYLPKKGDVVIGKIDDVRFSMWGVDINSPYPGILPASEVFGRDKKDLSRVFDIGDVLFLRIVDVDEVKKVKLGLKGRGMGKFKGGIIVDIAPTKVPRLIGKKGSMINMIKDKTGCKIVVGQNGLVWVKGKQDMELCLLIDGELPEEENEEMEENFDDAFKKPELQDFREEAERELADEKAQNEEDFDDLDEDIDESEDDFEDSDDYEDGLDESEDDFDEDLEESEDDFDDVDESEEDIDESEEDIGEFEDDLEEDEPESEDEDESDDEIVEEDEAESEDEIVDDESDDEIVEEDEAESEEETVDEESEEAVDEESEEAVDEESEESESVDLEEEGEEKPKESKFLDTFKHIKEQEKRNKSSFDLSRGNRKSPTLNISSNK